MSDTITTYADGFGNWHALVSGAIYNGRRKATMAARRAILDELEQRGTVDPRQVHITYIDTDRQNVHHFTEVV